MRRRRTDSRLGLVPLLGAVGAAVDYSRAGAIRTAMQAALDATALTLAKQNASGDALNQSATNLFNANFVRTGVQDVQVSGSSSPASGGSTVSLSAGGAVRTHFMRIFGFATVP